MEDCPMPKKPTEEFGGIAFGKDGSVTSRIERLPDLKAAQERALGVRFSTVIGAVYTQLDENDNDFKIALHQKSVIVEATEITSREYLIAVAEDDMDVGNHQMTDDGKYARIDEDACSQLILDKYLRKEGKYHRTEPLWLLM
jgi:hypothetical protein